jgi:nitrite reductase (NADH) large subunit
MTVIPIVPVAAAEAAAKSAAADAERSAAAHFFRNYTQRASRLPAALWWVARALVLALALALAAVLVLRPELGLTLFWGLAIPLVPALLVVAPGLWRQVCPMATLNQIPRQLGWQRQAELPEALKAGAFGIAVALFVAAVSLRVPLLNHSGLVTGLGVLGALVLAGAGGLAFKGRSGWCGTFCPLGPIQRNYGQAPLVVVKNGWCEPCVGCQKNCYDFNPRAAVFSDVYDEDPRYAAQRRLFFGLLPGLILGYFLQGPAPAYGTAGQVAVLLASAAASAGLYQLLLVFVAGSEAQGRALTPYRLSMAFAGVALAAFYAFAGPVVVNTLATLAGTVVPEALVAASRGTGVVLALALAAAGLRAERRWQVARRKPVVGAAGASGASGAAGAAAPAARGAGAALREQLAAHGGAEVTDRGSGVSFAVEGEQTLLEALQAAGLKINYGCRAGVCGADPGGGVRGRREPLAAVRRGARHPATPGPGGPGAHGLRVHRQRARHHRPRSQRRAGARSGRQARGARA